MEVPPLSQTSKRPGARDISDLKARLGLKKTNTAAPGGAPVAPPGVAQPPAPGGIVPPPGANVQGSIPAPPGVAPPPAQPQPQAQVPDASSDPFGAMSAMAQNAAVVSQPEIVVVNDGSSVESVAKKNKAATIGRTAAMVFLPLIAGVLIGKIGAGASQYNQVITDAKPIMEDVKIVRGGLTELTAALESGKQNGKFVPGDEKLTASLAALQAVPTNDELVYESSLYHLDSNISREIYTFYSDIHTLNAMLKEHLREAKKESKILKEGAVKFKGFNPMAYGAVVQIPSAEDAAAGAPVTMRMVQLGGPVCEGETKPNPAGCGGKPFTGFAYRDDQTGGWKVDKVPVPGSDSIPGDSVVMLDPASKSIKQIITGGAATLAEIAYTKRIEAIEAKVNQLNDTGKTIQKVLKEKSQESGKFSFFL